MQIKKGMSDYKQEVTNLYEQAFKESKCETYNSLGILDLNICYGLFDGEKLVSFVGVKTKKALDNDKEISLANICAVMTDEGYKGQKKAIGLLEHVINEIKDEYDSVVLQTINWDIYKQLELVDCTKKLVYEYIPGMYPVPMLIVWYEPEVNLIREIESSCNDNCIGIVRTNDEIEKTIAMYKCEGLKFMSNPGAYVWYDENANIIEMQYSNLSNLIWLLHYIQPKSELLFFANEDLEKIPAIKNTNREVVITKTFKESKNKFINIKLNDYLI
ncbi:MAG: GNAT family N-acetyltransferase [Mycoplasma sp.]